MRNLHRTCRYDTGPRGTPWAAGHAAVPAKVPEISVQETESRSQIQVMLKWSWWHASHVRLRAYNPRFLAVQCPFNDRHLFFQDLCLFKMKASYLRWRFKCQIWCVKIKAKPSRAEKHVLLVQWTDAVPSHWDLFFRYVLHNHALTLGYISGTSGLYL